MLCYVGPLVCLLALGPVARADPLTRAQGIVGYPNSMGNHEAGPERYQVPIDAMPYATPARIRIKLTRDIKTLDNDDDKMQAPEMSYFGVIGVGTPAKLFNVVLDTGSDEIWLPSWNWFPFANNLHYRDGFDRKDSSTCVRRDKEFQIDYRGTRLTGAVHDDQFTFYDGLTKEEAKLLPSAQLNFGQNFLLISDASNDQFRYKPYDGVVGLAPIAHSSTGTRNLLLSIQAQYANDVKHNASMPEPIMYGQQQPVIAYPAYPANNYNTHNQPNDYYNRQQMRRSGFTDLHYDLIFSFWFNPNLNTRDGGEVMLGDVDESRFIGEIIFHRVNSWFDWQLHLHHVQLGSQVVSCPDGCNAVFDTGANSLIGPRDDVQRIYDDLQAHRDSNSGLWLVDCNSLDSYPVFVFRIDAYPYMIYPTHYVKMFRFKDRLVCYLALKQRDSRDWVLGTAFIGAYYSVFNFSQRQIGLATPRS